MKAVRVKFENESYNYITAVNPKLSNKEIEDYFIGKYFNVGVYPVENIQKCIGIDFIDY